MAAQSLVGSAAHALRRSAHAAMDLSLQPARPAQQTLMQSNHLVLETVEMVNAFGLKCEEKLLRLHQKMQRLEVDVRLLETKLNSIPGLEASAAPPPAAGAAPRARAPSPRRRRRRRRRPTAAARSSPATATRRRRRRPPRRRPPTRRPSRPRRSR